MMTSFKSLTLSALAVALLLAVPFASAQEEAPAEVSSGGAGTLVLLMGLGALALVGGVTLLRQRNAPPNENDQG